MIITLSKDASNRLIIAFLYNPLLIEKVKNILGHQWHPGKKYWSFPNSNGILEKILKAFEGEEIHLAPALQSQFSNSVIARSLRPKQSQKDYQATLKERYMTEPVITCPKCPTENKLTESLAAPIKESATSVIFVHNHPSGDPEPSKEDIQITNRLVEAGNIIGIKILDHIIIGNEQYVSFKDRGIMP